MKVTKENINSIQYIPGCKTSNDLHEAKNILESLLIDIEGINQILEDTGLQHKQIYINYIDEHSEYSPERTDPCPDYYGWFLLVFKNNKYETAGCEMTLDELDTVICALYNFIEH